MKKNSLFKAILIVLGAVMLVCGVLSVCGYFVPALNGLFTMIPIGDVFVSYIQTFYYFFDTIMFLLVLGAFYGVLNEVPAYKKLVDNIVQKVKGHSKLFVLIVTGLVAVITSVSGLTGLLLIFVPLLVTIIMALGYDKLVALSATVVAMLVGFSSSLFVTFSDPNSYYGYVATTFEGVTGSGMYDNLWFKLALLVLGTGLLIFFINRHIKSVQDKKVKYDLNDSSEVAVSEVKGDYKNIRTWPIVLVLVLLLVVMLIGYIPWGTLFGVKCFDDFNTWLLGLKTGEFVWVTNLFANQGNFVALGSWASLGSYVVMTCLLIVAAFVIKLIYGVKFDEFVDNFVSGAKKVLPVVLLLSLSYVILIVSYNHGIVSNLITWLNDAIGINVGTATIVTFVTTLLHSDLYYSVAGGLLQMTGKASEGLLPILALNFQSIYGVVTMIAPTSLFVIFGLKYFDVPYTTWLKYIWRFALILVLLVLLVLLVATLLI